MGLFDSKYETVVGTTVSRVIKDELLPNAIRTGTTKAILNGGDIPERVMSELVSSIGVKADRLYEYGANHYTHGLPSGNFRSAIEGRDEVASVLSTIEGADVDLVYSHFAPPNLQHIGYQKLAADYHWNSLTNEIADKSTEIGYPVYLENMTVVIPAGDVDQYQQNALQQWGPAAKSGYAPSRPGGSVDLGYIRAQTPFVADPAASEAHILVDWVWEIPAATVYEGVFYAAAELRYGSFTIPITGFDDDADYWHVMYTVPSVSNERRFWMYEAGLGTYPTLDVTFNPDAPEENGTFFPFAYFRYNKVSEIEDTTTETYHTTKRLVKYLGMDFDEVAAAIDENPGIDDVEQAMLTFGVPANTEDPLELRYLYEFFDKFYDSDANQFGSIPQMQIAMYQARDLDIVKTALIIQDKRFKMSLTNAGMTKQRVVGNVGDVGAYAMATDTVYVDRTYYDPATDTMQTQSFPVRVHIYRKQITATMYDEIRIVQLRMLYYVFGIFTVTADEEDDILLIPVDRSICGDWSIPDKETLYARSLHFVFNSLVIVEIKWYQQDWFQFVMAVAAVAMAVSGNIEVLTALSQATLATISTIALTVLENFVISFAVSELVQLFVKAVGLEAAFIVAVVAAIAGGFQMLQAGGLQGAPWAKELLQLASGLAKATSAVLQDQMNGLASEFKELQLLADEKSKELEAANKLLENDNWLSPFVIFGEKPDDFYNRTIHSGNIGITSIGAISSYVDTALRLPTLDDTLGAPNYVA